MELLTATNIFKSYKIDTSTSIDVLKGIDISIKLGDNIALQGSSGSGKSTLLHILASLDKPDKGEIQYYTIPNKTFNISLMNDDELSLLRNKDIGIIYQFHHLLPEFTALENVMLPALIKGESLSDAKSTASKIIDNVSMSHRSNHYPKELSGGEQQRIAIARAIINKPKLIFADEPTGALDSANTKNIIQLLNDLKSEYNLTMLIATHSDEVADKSAKIYFLENGKLTTTK